MCIYYLLPICCCFFFLFSIFDGNNAKPTKKKIYTGSWSASTSPARSPSPSRYGGHTRRPELPYPSYGTTSLCQRSRSPSPARLQEMRERDRLGYGIDMGTFSLSHTLSNSLSLSHSHNTQTVTHTAIKSNLHAHIILNKI